MITQSAFKLVGAIAWANEAGHGFDVGKNEGVYLDAACLLSGGLALCVDVFASEAIVAFDL